MLTNELSKRGTINRRCCNTKFVAKINLTPPVKRLLLLFIVHRSFTSYRVLLPSSFGSSQFCRETANFTTKILHCGRRTDIRHRQWAIAIAPRSNWQIPPASDPTVALTPAHTNTTYSYVNICLLYPPKKPLSPLTQCEISITKAVLRRMLVEWASRFRVCAGWSCPKKIGSSSANRLRVPSEEESRGLCARPKEHRELSRQLSPRLSKKF